MEFVDGENLAVLLRRIGRLSADKAVEIARRLCAGLAAAHNQGVLHRDLKPANIMIDIHKRPVVMDFGIAKVIGRSTGLTAHGAILGTPAYMAPEQAGDEPDKVGPLSDVYSLGAILYRLLTGRPAYVADSTLLTLLQVISPEMPPPVRDLRPDVPPGVDQVVMKCLSKSPEKRYPSAKAFALALAQEMTQLRTQLPIPKAPPEAPPTFTLVVEKTGKTIRLSKPVNTVGRSSDCDVTLKAADVSKQHCRLLWQAGAVVVEDLDSANGTCVNDEAITRAVLRDGDVLKVAGHALRVRLPKGTT